MAVGEATAAGETAARVSFSRVGMAKTTAE